MVAHLARTNRWIARELGISPETVKNALSSAYLKLGVSGPGARIRAIVAALRAGILAIPDLDAAADECTTPAGWDPARWAQLHTARWKQWKQEPNSSS